MNNEIIYKDNLADDISENRGFTITNYPDGQRNVILDLESLNIKEMVDINARIKSYSDFEILNCLVYALRIHGFYTNAIDLLYLMGMRSDRSFVAGDCNYVEGAIAPQLNELSKFARFVRIHMPHSKLFLKCNGYRWDTTGPVDLLPQELWRDSIIIGGDQSVKDETEVQYVFDKRRDKESGNIVVHLDQSTEKEIIDNLISPIVIYDDLCDGGATFIAEAQYLRERGLLEGRKLYLAVVHGLFTGGVDRVAEHFEHIYCTNSYSNIEHPKVTQVEVI